jgi:hypothetical protein
MTINEIALPQEYQQGIIEATKRQLKQMVA